MRLLFAHDHRFLRGPDGAVYTVGSFPHSVWRRYLAAFDEIVVVARDGGPPTEKGGLARSDAPGVRFALVERFTLSQRLLGLPGEAKTILEHEMSQADAVLVRVPSDLGTMAARMARRQHKVWAGEAVGCAFDGYGNFGSPLARAYAPLAMQRMRGVAASAEQMLYVTREFLQRRYPGPPGSVGISDVEIVPLGTTEAAQRQERLAQLQAGRRPVFGTVASLRTMSKGIQDAIAGLGRLRSQGLELQYRVLGPGDEEPWRAKAREAGVADQVHFDGTRPSGDGVRRWLDTIDVHLQPSYQEGLPRATVEAMGRGCACSGSTAGGLPELLPPSRLHSPGAVLELSALMERFVKEPQFLAEASATDLATSAGYLPEALDEARETFYSRLAERARAARV